MSGQRGVIGFKIQLQMLLQAILAQEIQASGSVGVILMFGRLLRFRLNVKLSLKADGLLIFDGHVEKAAKMIEFAFDVRVPKCGIAFASAPKNIALAAEFVRDLDRLF